jgi:hypothetical protein
MRHQNLTGALLLAAGVVALMGIITAETFRPGYSTREEAISDLGASPPPAGEGSTGSGGLRGGWRIRSSSGRSGLEVI